MPAPRGLVQLIDQELHKSRLLPRGARLLVAVSGGADSVALLRLLHAVNSSDYWRWELVVGHVDHGIRGAASAADAQWVKQLAAELRLANDACELHLEADCSEALARVGRYKALSELVDRHQCAGVVLGHHADDQIETVLMRIFRGCGVEGLRGMVEEVKVGPEGRLTVWRPLLQMRRTELRGFLGEIGQTWREDASNQLMDYLRNRVRAEVLPVIEGVWPKGVESIGRLSRIAGEVQRVMDFEAEKLWENSRRLRSPSRIEFPRKALRESFPALIAQVLRYALVVLWGTSEIADYERISEAVRQIQGTEGGKEIQMGRNIVVELDGDVVRVAVRWAEHPPATEGEP